MQTLIFRVSLLLVMLVSFPTSYIWSRSPTQALTSNDFFSRQLIVKLAAAQTSPTDESAFLALLNQTIGHTLIYVRPMATGAHVFRLAPEENSVEVALIVQSIQRNALLLGVEYAEVDRIIQPAFTPDDPSYSTQWDKQAVTPSSYGIDLPAAWDITSGFSNTVVAIVDTGIRPNHPEFAGRLLNGYDFITSVDIANDGDGHDSNSSDPGDWVTSAETSGTKYVGCATTSSSWHGTHVAGIIGATGNNGLGIAGVNWRTKILPVRVLGKCGGFTSDVADGMMWAAGFPVIGVPTNPSPAKVINLSLGATGGCAKTEQAAVDAAKNLGALIVVAAGNNNSDGVTSLASCNGVIAVAATDKSGNKAYYSNYGSKITISAPGGGSGINGAIYSTVDVGSQAPQAPGYGYKIGTSMAAPQVSGVLALMLGLDPSLTPTRAQTELLNQVTAFPANSSCNIATCGAGILNAGKAIRAIAPADSSPTPVVTPTPSATPIPTATPAPNKIVSPTPTAPVFTPSPSPSLEPSINITFKLRNHTVVAVFETTTSDKATIKYGTRQGQYTTEVSEKAFQQNHALDLPEMKPGVTYYYVLVQMDMADRTSQTSEMTIYIDIQNQLFLPLLSTT